MNASIDYAKPLEVLSVQTIRVGKASEGYPRDEASFTQLGLRILGRSVTLDLKYGREGLEVQLSAPLEGSRIDTFTGGMSSIRWQESTPFEGEHGFEPPFTKLIHDLGDLFNFDPLHCELFAAAFEDFIVAVVSEVRRIDARRSAPAVPWIDTWRSELQFVAEAVGNKLLSPVSLAMVGANSV